jgi:RNA polymerase sigma-70 factor (ECF subfamily)
VLADHYRWRKRKGDKIHPEELLSEQHGEEAAAETRLVLAEAIGAMTEDQRTAFTMLQLDGVSVEAVGQSTSASASAVKVRAHRAYKVLRAALARGGDDDE